MVLSAVTAAALCPRPQLCPSRRPPQCGTVAIPDHHLTRGPQPHTARTPSLSQRPRETHRCCPPRPSHSTAPWWWGMEGRDFALGQREGWVTDTRGRAGTTAHQPKQQGPILVPTSDPGRGLLTQRCLGRWVPMAHRSGPAAHACCAWLSGRPLAPSLFLGRLLTPGLHPQPCRPPGTAPPLARLLGAWSGRDPLSVLLAVGGDHWGPPAPPL